MHCEDVTAAKSYYSPQNINAPDGHSTWAMNGINRMRLKSLSWKY